MNKGHSYWSIIWTTASVPVCVITEIYPKDGQICVCLVSLAITLAQVTFTLCHSCPLSFILILLVNIQCPLKTPQVRC